MYKCGLVLEGGGNRAIFASGVLDVLIENGIEFPYVIGVSAGSCNAASFIGKCKGRQHDIMVNYSDRYMRFSNIIKNHEYIDLDWLFGELTYDIKPLDYDTFENSNTTLCVVTTNALTGKPEYFYPKSFRDRCEELKASCAMPIATNGIKIGNQTYFDGGLTDSIPFEKALNDGCEKIIVITTRDRNYKKTPVNETLSNKFLKDYPLVADAVTFRHEMYNDQLSNLKLLEESGDALVVRPSVRLDASSVEKSKSKLESIYQLGIIQGKRNLDKIKAFIEA